MNVNFVFRPSFFLCVCVCLCAFYCLFVFVCCCFSSPPSFFLFFFYYYFFFYVLCLTISQRVRERRETFGGWGRKRNTWFSPM
ncbi:hypothetical protein TCDM_05725 [Trypanosoma cruzi Dm28c]|uniref:Uncharacterized protein n=1 Tax=Trypanosoma cruzi Dm28c TaxID=1416333 RepID=V5BDF4_TRYCR|nr:hypothetical protein TCDM_05725 [Trypanosoma cruzi Dm28c]